MPASETKERPKKPPLRARLRARWPEIRNIYFTFDPRSLGLARIGLGVLLLYDLWRRVGGIPTWYTNEGLLPNHAVLWRPDSDYIFSFFFAASTAGEAAVLFVLTALVYLCFLVGWHTRLVHLLAFACMVSVHSRGTFLENGGDVALNLLCGWTLFLPMGVRFSIDALARSLHARREHAVSELGDRSVWRAPAARPVVSLAVLAVLLQVSVIYYFNAVHKHGWTWREGKAIHYVLYQERMVTWFGVLVRRHMTPLLSMIMTYATLLVEISAPLLILNPVLRYRTRTIAILIYPALHFAFAAFLNLGQFSFNMMGYFPLLLSPTDWQAINRWVAPPEHRARTVRFDPSSPLLSALARLLARLDAFDRLTFEALTPSAPEGDDAKPAAPSPWVVVNAATAAQTTGVLAMAECVEALAFGRLLGAMLRTGVGQKMARFAYRFIARRERTLEASFGWEAITPAGVVSPADVPREPAESDEGPPVRRWIRRRTTELRELALVVLVVAVASQVLMENKAVPPQLKWGQPKWILQLVGYPRMFQGWGMFSSDVPTGERMLYVDAVTFGGRHVDPFNEAGSRVANLPVDRIPEHMEQDEFWCDYTNRIPERQPYWRMLKEWILAYHLRTMRREDRILSFEAKLIESDSPPPGEHEVRNIRTKVMMTDRDP
ncbi:MAG TPA: HTTM domain-containing protein [Polyangiaceae bacterium]|nr:HTTM domain-containing protein [Polyangiaceae bacterium]